MRISSIASGSRGNCILVSNEGTNILVDAGISKKRIEEGLSKFNVSPDKLDGILVTHEHADHIGGLGVFLRKYSIPVYSTSDTIKAILNDKKIGNVDTDLFYSVKAESVFNIKDIDVKSIRISHDAVDPVCFKFHDNNKTCAVATDIGVADKRLINELSDLDAILIEANHDVNMLYAGPYPYHLKRRIKSDKGHLSNESCGRILSEIASDKLKHIILGHLSGENNYPKLAFEAVRNEINFSKNKYNSDYFDIQVASRTEPSCDIVF